MQAAWKAYGAEGSHTLLPTGEASTMQGATAAPVRVTKPKGVIAAEQIALLALGDDIAANWIKPKITVKANALPNIA